jgi:acyl-coenzyme A thioesterase PaaI-like protein
MGIIMTNKFSTIIKKANKAPLFLRSFLLTKLFSSKVKFAGTTGIVIQKVSHHEVIIGLANKTKVQNHIGGIHAVAAAVLAESATGIVFGMNVPDSKLPLLKTMKIDYQRRMQGNLQAIARLTDTQISSISDDEKGSVIVPVSITDESAQAPIECCMEWAWVRKR